MITREYDMPVWALAACLRWDNLGEGSPVIAETPTWRDEQTERELNDATRAELERNELLASDGRTTPEFRDTLVVLARPGVEYTCWANGVDGAYRMMVAAVGKDTALLVRTGEHVWIRPASADAPAEELVSWLPQVEPAAAPAINASRDAYDALTVPERTTVLDHRETSQDAKRLQAVMEQPRLHAAELHAAVRNRSGSRRRAQHANVIDTEQGRWLVHRKDDWIVAAPGTPQLLASTLYEMRDQAR